MSFLVKPPYELFTDVDGQALEAGYIYIGTAGLDPETNLVSVYWDEDLSILASQPLRTIGGHLTNSGSPGNIFTSDGSYSISVRNKNGSLVYTNLNVGADLRTLYVEDYTELRSLPTSVLINGLPLEVTNAGIGGTGILRNVVGHGITSLVGVQVRINDDWFWERIRTSDEVNVQWFEVKGDGTDETAKAQAAINTLTRFGQTVYWPGTDSFYNVTDLNPYSSGITQNKYSSTIAGGQLNLVTFRGDGFLATILKSTTGNVLRARDPADPIPATPGRFSFRCESLALIGDDSNTSSTKTGIGFYGDTAEVSMSYTWFKDCLISYFDRGYNYLGYEGSGPLADGHAIFENCIITQNNIGTVTAVDNVVYLNCYVSRNNQYGSWVREGLCVEIIGGKWQLNGQDNFGTSDAFAKVGQIRIGGTTTRSGDVGNISLRGVYLEPTFETGNTKHSFFDVYQEDTNTRTMKLSSLRLDNCYVNGKDCTNLIRTDNNCVLDNVEIENGSVLVNFRLPATELITLGSSSRVRSGKLDSSNTMVILDAGGSAIHSDLIRLVDPRSTTSSFNYSISNQTGIRVSFGLLAPIANLGIHTTALNVGAMRSMYRITINDAFISGANENIAVPYVGLYTVTPNDVDQQNILNTGYAFAVDGSGFLTITNNTGGARQFAYCIEKLL